MASVWCKWEMFKSGNFRDFRASSIHERLTDSSFIDFTADLQTARLPVAPLAAEHVSAHGPASPPRGSRAPVGGRGIDVNAGGGVINGVGELYHPEEEQPSARDEAAVEALRGRNNHPCVAATGRSELRDCACSLVLPRSRGGGCAPPDSVNTSSPQNPPKPLHQAT